LWTNDELREELRAELIAHPPSVLVLDNTVRREVGVAGKDENSIDREVFPYQAVAHACYRQESGSPTVWLPVHGDRRMTSTCIERQLELAGLPAS
jgi:hypothetical protein